MSNRQSWLDLISRAEGTWRNGGRGYNIYYGGGTFDNTQNHPNKVIQPTQNSIPSSAAGAYQFMPSTWQGQGGGTMTPERQDEYAYRLGLGRGVDFDTAPINATNIALLAPEWASLPTAAGKSYYPNQTAKTMKELSSFLNQGPTGQPKTSQVNEEQVPTLLKLMEGVLGSYPNPSSYQSLMDVDADPRLIAAALAPDSEIINTEATSNDKAIKELQKTQDTILKLIKQNSNLSEKGATTRGLKKSFEDAYSAFQPGSSVI
tara:strand:- start:7502 stop:8284 length:783 start_codon:yes stop_codon:yes gene_type:complete